MPRSKCAEDTADDLLEAYERHGYDLVCLTDHDAVWPQDEISDLLSRHPHLTILPGIEKSLGTNRCEHLLILGTSNPVFLENANEQRIVQLARNHGCLTVLAHPFLTRECSGMLQLGILPDAIESLTRSHDSKNAKQSMLAAKKYNLPLVNSGDVHNLAQVNKYWIETNEETRTATGLRAMIQRRAYRRCAVEGTANNRV